MHLQLYLLRFLRQNSNNFHKFYQFLIMYNSLNAIKQLIESDKTVVTSEEIPGRISNYYFH